MRKLLEIKKEYRQVPNTTGVEVIEYAYFYDDEKQEVIKIKVIEPTHD